MKQIPYADTNLGELIDLYELGFEIELLDGNAIINLGAEGND